MHVKIYQQRARLKSIGWAINWAVPEPAVNHDLLDHYSTTEYNIIWSSNKERRALLHHSLNKTPFVLKIVVFWSASAISIHQYGRRDIRL